MNTTAKIYVAGHTGLVGSALMRILCFGGYQNIVTRSFDALDLRDQQAVMKFFELERPEYVFLAAAKVGGIMANSMYKADFIYDNMMIAANVIHASYRYGVKKLLNLGSSCIYPKHAPQPLVEESLLTGSLEPTNEPYAVAKIAAIKLCRYYNEQYATNFISVMPTNLYGPYDNFNLHTGHVLPSLIKKFHLAKLLQQRDFDGILYDLCKDGFGLDDLLLNGVATKDKIMHILQTLGVTSEQVVLWGTGGVYREFLHVDDLAEAVVFLMEQYDAKDLGECINIGFGADIMIKDLALLVQAVVGHRGHIAYQSTKPDGTPKKLLDISRISMLGWRAKIPLQVGINSVYEWYVSNMQPLQLHDVGAQNVEAIH